MSLRADLEQTAILAGQLEATVAAQTATIDSQSQAISDLHRQLAECLEGVPPPPPPPPPPVVWPPSGFVQTVAADFAKAVNDHPAGTKFALAGGTYPKTFPLKAGNRYDGDPSNKPVFKGDGLASSPFLVANVANVTLRNIIAEGFGPNTTQEGGAMVDYQGGDGWLVEDCEFSHTANVVVRWGSGWTLRRTHLHHAGRFAQAGGGRGALKLIEDCKWSYVGITHDGVKAVASNNRGGCKFAKASHVTARRLEIFESGWNGFWADIQNEDFWLEDIYAHRIARIPIFLEVSYGPFKVIRPRLDDFGYLAVTADPDVVPAGILVSMTPDVEIVDPDINNGPNGIISHQWPHPQILGVKDGQPFGDTDKSRCGNENLLVHGTGRITNIERWTAGLNGPYQKGTRPTRNLIWDLRDIEVDDGARFKSALTI